MVGVVRDAADGMTNRQIAQAQFVTNDDAAIRGWVTRPPQVGRRVTGNVVDWLTIPTWLRR